MLSELNIFISRKKVIPYSNLNIIQQQNLLLLAQSLIKYIPECRARAYVTNINV